MAMNWTYKIKIRKKRFKLNKINSNWKISWTSKIGNFVGISPKVKYEKKQRMKEMFIQNENSNNESTDPESNKRELWWNESVWNLSDDIFRWTFIHIEGKGKKRSVETHKRMRNGNQEKNRVDQNSIYRRHHLEYECERLQIHCKKKVQNVPDCSRRRIFGKKKEIEQLRQTWKNTWLVIGWTLEKQIEAAGKRSFSIE